MSVSPTIDDVARAAEAAQVHSERLLEDLERIGRDNASDKSRTVVHFCRCNNGGAPVVVANRGDLCPKCATAEAEELRAMVLAKARATLPRMAHATFGIGEAGYYALGAYVQGPILKSSQTWRATEGTNLVLLGDTGCGKTTAAVAVARRILDSAKTPDQVRIAAGTRFVSVRELHRARAELASAGYSAERVNGEAPAIAKAKRAVLLVLDEVGFEPEVRREQMPIVCDVVQDRYDAGLVTIVTSGLTELQLAHRYGEATKRRMTERARVVECFGGAG